MHPHMCHMLNVDIKGNRPRGIKAGHRDRPRLCKATNVTSAPIELQTALKLCVSYSTPFPSQATSCSLAFSIYSTPADKNRILASNRDEFFDRPAAPAAWHNFDRISGDAALDSSEQPWVLCGRDLGSVQGGTWIGMTRDLRIGAL